MFTTNIWSLNIKFPREPITIGPETEGLYCFYCTMLNFQWKLPKMGTMCWWAPTDEKHHHVTWLILTNGSTLYVLLIFLCKSELKIFIWLWFVNFCHCPLNESSFKPWIMMEPLHISSFSISSMVISKFNKKFTGFQ